jgi:hypothetical protein
MSEIDEAEEAQRRAEASLPTVKIRSSSLPDHLLKQILFILAEAVGKSTLQKDVAEYIKKAIDQKPELNTLPGKGPWQCIVGKSFAANVTGENGWSAFFDLPSTGETVLIYKSLGVNNE